MKILNTQRQGTSTELKVATYLLDLNYNVSQPFSQDSKYDLIVDVNNNLLRLQVKTSRWSNKNYTGITFNCRTTTSNVKNCKSRRYGADEIDYFATYWNGICYLIPVNECSTQKSLHLDENYYQSNWSMAKDYEAKKILSKYE